MKATELEEIERLKSQVEEIKNERDRLTERVMALTQERSRLAHEIHRLQALLQAKNLYDELHELGVEND